MTRADLVAAWATGIGAGWISFMVTWLIMNRVTSALLPIPTAPIVAMTLAILTGLTVSVWQGRRLTNSIR
jgi:hypothetical protein